MYLWMIKREVCHSFLTQLCGMPCLQLGFFFSGIKNWLTNSITKFYFFHHLSPYTGNLHAFAMECFVMCMRSLPTTVSKRSKLCEKIMKIFSSRPWNVEKKSNHPASLNLCAIWGKDSSNYVTSGSNLVICPLCFGAITLIQFYGRFMKMSRVRSPTF